MYPVSSKFLTALRGSHTAAFQVDAWRGGVKIATDLPVAAGSVTVDVASQVRRTLTITVADPTLAPTTPTDVLAPSGTELWVNRGIRHLTGEIEWCPVGVFRVQSTEYDATRGVIAVTGADRSVIVSDARFLHPTPSVTSHTIPAEIARLITDVTTVTVTDTTGETTLTPTVTWDKDRWAAIEDLATSIGAEVAFNAAGVAVLRPAPTVDGPVAWWVDAGESGVLVTGERALTRESVYNAVSASGERTDATPPVVAEVFDTDPTSPTYYSGPFGQVPRFYASPLLTTTAQATKAATTMLKRVRALTRKVTLSCVPNPALDVGDVVMVRWPDSTTERHLVDRIEIPLDAGTPMTVDTRSSNPALE